MKKIWLPVVLLAMMVVSCDKKVDVAAEEEAIKALIINETNAFLTQDLVGSLSSYADDPTTIYISIGSNGYKEYVGYERIKSYFQKSAETDWSDYSDFKVARSNWHFKVCGTNAMVHFDQRMTWNMNGEPMETHSKELRMLEKLKGEWKIMMTEWVDMAFFEEEVEEKTF